MDLPFVAKGVVRGVIEWWGGGVQGWWGGRVFAKTKYLPILGKKMIVFGIFRRFFCGLQTETVIFFRAKKWPNSASVTAVGYINLKRSVFAHQWYPRPHKGKISKKNLIFRILKSIDCSEITPTIEAVK